MISKPFQGYAVLLAVFALGGLAGAGGMHAFDQRRFGRFFGDRPVFEHRRLEAMARRLDLNGQQQEQLRKIVEDHAEERRALMNQALEPCNDAVHAAQAQLDGEIRALLSPDQAARFDAMSREHRGRRPPGAGR